VRTTVDLPEDLIKDLDGLAEETSMSRSDVIADLLDYCLADEKIIDEIYPEEEDEEEEEAEEAESEA